MIAKTTAERQRELRARRVAEARANRAAGLVRWECWIHPQDAPAMDALRDKLAKKRERERK
jgi:hypothetical protein